MTALLFNDIFHYYFSRRFVSAAPAAAAADIVIIRIHTAGFALSPVLTAWFLSAFLSFCVFLLFLSVRMEMTPRCSKPLGLMFPRSSEALLEYKFHMHS